MVDKVRPLKLESSSSGGTENDIFPSELSPSEDYVSTKGIAFEGSDNTRLELIENEISFVDPISGTHKLKTLKNADFCFTDKDAPYLENTSTTYKIIARFIFRGTVDVATPSIVRAAAFMSTTTNSGEVRLFDLTNNTSLGVSGAITGINPTLYNISTSSWSAGAAIIEVQIRKVSGSGGVRISALNLGW